MNLDDLRGMFASEEKPYAPEPEAKPVVEPIMITIDSFSSSLARLTKGFTSAAVGKLMDDLIQIQPAGFGKSMLGMQQLKMRNGGVINLEGRPQELFFMDEAERIHGKSYEMIQDFFTGEMAEYETPKENWATKRGMKGNLQAKKRNNPKGNQLYGTGWKQK